MITHILLAVDDSRDALAATRLAVELSRGLGARLRAVHVSADHHVEAAIEAATGTPVGVRRGDAEALLLARVVALAEAAGVAAETVLLRGRVEAALIQAARDWGADLVVIGKSDRGAVGDPYVGSLTRHVLEFAEQPVLVVPVPVRHR
ncbi:MAG TPA: universal stress protein [Candidatus Lustribacter sp.]|nr:universal stress protein [Candidatus Lustribacter sp.]